MSRKKEREMVRPGGRTERVRTTVIEAVLELIGSGNLEFNVPDVERLSGVHRATIHRRWPDRTSLIKLALAEHQAAIRNAIEIEYTGDLRADLRRFAVAFRDFCVNPHEVAISMVTASSKNREFVRESNDIWMPIHMEAMDLISQARMAGEIKNDVDPDMVVSMLVDPIVVETTFTRVAPSDEYLETLVGHVVQLCLSEKVAEKRKVAPKHGKRGS